MSEDTSIEVLREGHRTSISIYDLVVGDIIELRTGDKIPIDGLLISGSQVQTDESNLTGEPKFINKQSMVLHGDDEEMRDPFLLAGSKIMNG